MANSSDHLVAKKFPREWAAVANATGLKARKKRYELRRRYEYSLKFDALRATGAHCGNCRHYEDAPPGMDGKVCGERSDYHGYLMPKPDSLCLIWSKS